MGEIHYLPVRPRAHARPGPAPDAVPGPARFTVRVHLSVEQLASVLAGETLAVDGRLGARARAIVEAMPDAQPPSRNRLDVGPRGRADPAPATLARPAALRSIPGPHAGPSRPARTMPGAGAALAVGMVRAGRALLASGTAGGSDGTNDGHGIGGGTLADSPHRPAFAFADREALEHVLGEAVRGHRSRLEAWLRQGGRVPVRLRYRAIEPFGTILHDGASEPSALHGIALSVSLSGTSLAGGGGSPGAVVVEFSATP